MKFVIDQTIPFIKGTLEPYAEIVYLDGPSISNADLKDADALIILHHTRCNRELLQGTSVKIIATATIGTDHIDLAYCKANNIYVQNAPGCNSGGVMNYVFFLAAAVIGCLPIFPKIRVALTNRESVHFAPGLVIAWEIVVCVVLLAVCTTLLVGESYNPFLYFRF